MSHLKLGREYFKIFLNIVNKIKFIIFFTSPIICYSQQKETTPKEYFQKEISGISDNDNYTLQVRDGYYTNGIYFKLSCAADPLKSKRFNRPAIKKIVNGFEIGQAIYTPIDTSKVLPQDQDRPFAGYLAFTFDKKLFYGNNSIVEFGATLGTIGPNSFAENVQSWFHGISGLYINNGWPTQIKNEINLNLKASYSKPIIKGNYEKRFFNMDGFIKAQIGNAVTNARMGALIRIGKMENNWNSTHWKAAITANKNVAPVRRVELYFFNEPSITFQVYNSMLQGGMFIKNKGPVVVDIKSIVFTNKIGVLAAEDPFTTSIIYIFRSKEAQTQIRNENFCSIQIGYRFNKTK